MPTTRKVAKKTEAEFKDKARGETFAASPVEGSLERMAGSSQRTAGRHARVRQEIEKKAKHLSRTRP
jgi:hypothetical protein